MFQNILLPLDGSDFSSGATAAAFALAKTLNARVTAIHATLPVDQLTATAALSFFATDTYTKHAAESAAAILDQARVSADKAGIPFTAVHIEHVHPWEAIVQTAKERGCDLIVMASHGRRGIAGLLLGSETHKVLTHTTVPVLVWRA